MVLVEKNRENAECVLMMKIVIMDNIVVLLKRYVDIKELFAMERN
jgi:hypothetical protein